MYVAWGEHRANAEHLPNPIKYVYLKSDKYRDDRELRSSLSAIGMGHFVLNDGSEMGFPSSLHFDVDFRAALADGTITEFVARPGLRQGFPSRGTQQTAHRASRESAKMIRAAYSALGSQTYTDWKIAVHTLN